ELAKDELVRGDVRDALKNVNDIERLVSRCAAGLANARDLVGLKESLYRLPQIREILSNCCADLLLALTDKLGPTSTLPRSNPPTLLAEQKQAYANTVNDVAALIGRAIA